MKPLFTSSHSMQKLAFLFILSLLSLTSVAHADDVRYYDVETIIFESLDPGARAAENWKAEVTPDIPKVFAELDQPYPGPIPSQYDPALTFKSLPASQYQLTTDEQLLSDSHQYRILLHTAWVQPGMGPDVALPVHITRTFVSDTPVSHSLVPAGTDAPAANLPTATTDTQTRSVLDGYIKIILTRYLHADVDITYTTGLPLLPDNQAAPSSGMPTQSTTGALTQDTTPGTPQTAQQNPQNPAAGNPALPAPVVYELHQSRRMRSKELHYLDHPVLGMLLLITPHATK